MTFLIAIFALLNKEDLKLFLLSKGETLLS